MAKRIENGREIKAFFAAGPIHGSEIFEEIEFFFVAGVASNFGKIGGIDDEIGLLSIFERIEDGGTEALAVAAGQFVIERNLNGRFGRRGRSFGSGRSRGRFCRWGHGRGAGTLRFGTLRLGRLGFVCH